jgi:hypothetical protein
METFLPMTARRIPELGRSTCALGAALKLRNPTFVSALAAAAALGLVASRPNAPVVVLALGSVIAFLIILFRRPGIAVGLLVLGVQNGLPVLDTATTFLNGLALGNYLAYALIVILAVRWVAGAHPRGAPRGARELGLVGFGLAVWWLITVARSTSEGVPLTAAAAFGRNFLIFAILTVLFPRGLHSARARRDALLTVCAGALLYSVGQILITTSGARVSWLVHPVAIRTSEVGLQRVYAFMSDPAVLLFCLAVGAALLSVSRKSRRTGTLVAVVSGVAIVLQQTRAIYLSLPLALVLLMTLWATFVPTARRRLGRRSVAGVIAMALLLALLAAIAPQMITTYGAQPLSRLNGVFSEISSSTGNIGYRFNLAHGLLQLLGGRVSNWLTGLGFLDPKYRYFSGLPLGSIRNSDLGLIDGIMLIGIVGILMIYSTVALLLWRLFDVARSWRAHLPDEGWVVFGISAWTAQVLLASYSLGTLFQEQGQVLFALVIGIGINACGEYARAGAQSVVTRQRFDNIARPLTKTGEQPLSASV